MKLFVKYYSKLSIIFFSQRGILFIFPWRDSLGFIIGGLPFRFGELFSFISGGCLFFAGNGKLKKNEIIIFYILIINFLWSIIGIVCYIDTINIHFATKYLIRNLVYILFVLGFLSSNISFSHHDIDRLLKFFVILHFLFFVILEITGGHMLFLELQGWDRIISTGQYVNIAGIMLPRFMGGAMEAGYLAPLFVIPIYYYVCSYIASQSQNKRLNSLVYLLITYILTIFTFSTAVYVFAAIATILAIFNNINSKRTIKILFILGVALSLFFLLIVLNSSLSKYFFHEYIYKILAYFGDDSVSNWSANDRNQHFINALNIFFDSSFSQFFLGHGTGAYYALSILQTGLMVSDVNEAYNLFLSSLVDRGLIGFLVLVVLFFLLRMFKTQSISSKTIYIGILFQYIHWMITGNFWLYYFWYEIVILLGIYRYEKRSIVL